MMLITLKAKLRRNIINVMTEESDAENEHNENITNIDSDVNNETTEQ